MVVEREKNYGRDRERDELEREMRPSRRRGTPENMAAKERGSHGREMRGGEGSPFLFF